VLTMPPAGLWAQEVPAQPAPRQGQILDVSADPVLAKLPAKRLTVDIDKQPAQDAARAMAAGGLSLAINPGPYLDWDDQVVTLHLHDVPYMEGLMEIRQQLRARIKDANGVKVTLTYQPDEEIPPWCLAGPFVVLYYGIAREVQYHYDYRTGQPEPGGPSQQAFLRMDLLAEPGMEVIQSMRDVQCAGLADDKHQAIGIGPRRQRGITSEHPVELTLILPESPGRWMPLLKGTIDAKVGQMLHVDLANVTQKQTPPPVEGMTIEVGPLVPRNGSAIFFTLPVKYSRGTMPPERWAHVAPLLPAAKLTINGSGHGQVSARSSPPRLGDDTPAGDQLTIQYAVTIAKGAGPTGKATLDLPMGATEVRVPFVFKDVILP